MTKITVVWDVTPCGLVDRYQHFFSMISAVFFETSVPMHYKTWHHTPKTVIVIRPSESRISRIGLTGCVWCMTTGTNDRAQSAVDAEASSNNKFSSRTRLLFLPTAYLLLVNNQKNRRFLVVAPAVGRDHLGKERLCFRWITRRKGLQLCYTLLEIQNQHSLVGIVARLWAGPASNCGSIL